MASWSYPGGGTCLSLARTAPRTETDRATAVPVNHGPIRRRISDTCTYTVMTEPPVPFITTHTGPLFFRRPLALGSGSEQAEAVSQGGERRSKSGAAPTHGGSRQPELCLLPLQPPQKGDEQHAHFRFPVRTGNRKCACCPDRRFLGKGERGIGNRSRRPQREIRLADLQRRSLAC